MQKILQRFTIVIPAADTNSAGEFSLREVLRDDYQKCTGVFIVKEMNTDTGKIFCRLNIANIEILPKEVALMLIEYNGNFALKESIYNFEKDNIPARSSAVEMDFTNFIENEIKLSVYFVLENQ